MMTKYKELFSPIYFPCSPTSISQSTLSLYIISFTPTTKQSNSAELHTRQRRYHQPPPLNSRRSQLLPLRLPSLSLSHFTTELDFPQIENPNPVRPNRRRCSPLLTALRRWELRSIPTVRDMHTTARFSFSHALTGHLRIRLFSASSFRSCCCQHQQPSRRIIAGNQQRCRRQRPCSLRVKLLSGRNSIRPEPPRNSPKPTRTAPIHPER